MKALEFKVTKRLLNELEEHYKQGQPKLQLFQDQSKNLKWKIIQKSIKENSLPKSLNELDFGQM